MFLKLDHKHIYALIFIPVLFESKAFKIVHGLT